MLHKRRQPIWLVSLLVVLAGGHARLLLAQDPETAKSESGNINDRAGASTTGLVDQYGDSLPAGAIARLGTIRFRHPGAITMLAVAPSGTEAITLSQGSGMLNRCDLKTGKVSDFFDLGPGFGGISSGRRTSLAFADSGRRLIVTGPNFVQVIDVEKKSSQKIDLPQGFAACSALSPDTKRLAVVQTGDNGRLLIINIETGKIDPDIPRVGNNPTDVAFTHDGTAVTISTHNRAEGLRSFSVETGKELPALKDNQTAAMSLAYSPNGKWLAVGQAQTAIWLYDLQSKTQKRTFGGFTSALRWVDFTSDSKDLLAFDGSGTLVVLDPESGEERQKITVGASATAPVLSPDGKTVVTSFGNVLDSWSIDTGESANPFEGHRSMVLQLAISPDCRWGATVGQDNTLRSWDLNNGKQVRVKQRPRYAPASAVSFTADGRQLLWANSPTTVEFFDVAELLKADSPANDTAREIRGNQFSTFSISEDGRMLVANNSAGGGTQVWDLTKKNPSPKLLRPMLAPQGVTFVAYSPDARLSATPYTVDGNSHQVVIADITAEREIARLPSMTGQPIQQGVFAGTRLFASRAIRQIALWDVLSAKPVINISAGVGMTTALACSPDGRLLAWAENDAARTIRLYDSLNARVVGTFTGHAGVIQTLQMQLTGDHPVLVSGSQDSTALVWKLDNVVNELRRTTPQLADQKADQLWADLGAEDAAAMHRAAWVLVAARDAALPLLDSRLRPVPVDQTLGSKIEKLVEQMDDDQFSAREQASLAVAELGEAAEPFLNEALKETNSAEARHRIRRILADIAGKPLLLSAEQQRSLRAVQILEQIGGDRSREVLLRLTQGQPSARLTVEAKNALARLDGRVSKQ